MELAPSLPAQEHLSSLPFIRALRHLGLPVVLGISEVLVMDHLHAGTGMVLGPCLSRQVPSVFSWSLWSSEEQTLNKLL